MIRKKKLNALEKERSQLERFKATLADKNERLKSIKEDMLFSNKILISNKKTIVILAKLRLPENAVGA